jgi:hypothetical protein
MGIAQRKNYIQTNHDGTADLKKTIEELLNNMRQETKIRKRVFEFFSI